MQVNNEKSCTPALIKLRIPATNNKLEKVEILHLSVGFPFLYSAYRTISKMPNARQKIMKQQLEVADP